MMRSGPMNVTDARASNSQVVISVPPNCFDLTHATLRYVGGHELRVIDGSPKIFFLCRISGRAGYGHFDREALAEHGDKVFAHLISISLAALYEIKQFAGPDEILENLVDAAIKHRKELRIKSEGCGGYQVTINREPYGLCCLPVKGNDRVIDVKRKYANVRDYAIEEMVLVFCGMELEDDHLLTDCGVFHRATLTLKLISNF